jgi:hypothetical protein
MPRPMKFIAGLCRMTARTKKTSEPASLRRVMTLASLKKLRGSLGPNGRLIIFNASKTVTI